eukprot:752121-Hanusia_phi.AAC.3
MEDKGAKGKRGGGVGKGFLSLQQVVNKCYGEHRAHESQHVLPAEMVSPSEASLFHHRNAFLSREMMAVSIDVPEAFSSDGSKDQTGEIEEQGPQHLSITQLTIANLPDIAEGSDNHQDSHEKLHQDVRSAGM